MGATGTSTNAEKLAGIPWTSPTLFAILAATLMTPMDVPMISPALPEIQRFFDITESRAGMFLSLYALPGILLAPAIGALADRIGRRYVLTGCLTVFGIAGTAIAFTNDFSIALGLRVVQGFAAGSLLASLAMTVVGDRYSGRQHDAIMGVTSAVLSLGTATYPIVGGYLAGRSWNAPFLMYALTLPVAAVVLFGLDESDTQLDSGKRGSLRETVRTIPIHQALSLYTIMFVSFGFLFGGIYTALPFFLVDGFGFNPTTVGLFTSTMLVVTGIVSTQNGRLAARMSTSVLLVTGFGLFALGFLGVALAGNPLFLIGALLVFGAGSGLVTPTLFAGISSLAPDHVRGSVMSLQTTTIGISQAIGPAVFTLLGGTVGYEGTILGASAGAAVCAAIIAIVPFE